LSFASGAPFVHLRTGEQVNQAPAGKFEVALARYVRSKGGYWSAAD
jgi:hypothetical protein